MKECATMTMYRYLSEAEANEGKKMYEQLGMAVTITHVKTETIFAWDSQKSPRIGNGDTWILIATV